MITVRTVGRFGPGRFRIFPRASTGSCGYDRGVAAKTGEHSSETNPKATDTSYHGNGGDASAIPGATYCYYRAVVRQRDRDLRHGRV
jgi:hypothetical protein